MKLSIITINYNNAEGLRKTLASVAAQTYRNIEHIIVDGGSTDGSVDIIRDYENTIKRSVTIDQSTIQVKWLSEPDKGIYNAMNKGIEIALGKRVVNTFNRSERSEDKNIGIQRATGDYIWILNSGDCVASADVVKQMMTEVERMNNITNERVPILMGNIVHTFADERKEREKKVKKVNALTPWPMDVSMLTFYTGTVPHDAAFVRSDLFEKYGLFDDSMKICADWKLYLDMIALGGIQPLYVDIDVVNFDMSGISNTNNELRLTERRMYLEQVLPASVLKDYDAYARSIRQYERLKKHHLWVLVYFVERVLFKMEKWGVLR
jgi:glycosyltransferase involved in cell wall biosynthesis